MNISRWLRWFRSKRRTDSMQQSEIETITTELIEETRRDLQKRFDQVMEQKRENLTENEARIILQGLIKEAVAKRKLLSGRIEKSVEAGSLFDRYYGKMQTINALTNNAYAQMQKMKVTRDRLEFQRGIYNKLTGKMYLPEVIPDEKEKGSHRGGQHRDIWEKMDEEKNGEEGS